MQSIEVGRCYTHKFYLISHLHYKPGWIACWPGGSKQKAGETTTKSKFVDDDFKFAWAAMATVGQTAKPSLDVDRKLTR